MIGFGRGAGVWCVLAGTVFAGVRTGSAQETQTLHVTARLVVLDVTVTDARGNFVPGLDRSQFAVTEDGAPQTIRSFEGPQAHAMPEEAVGKMVVRSSKDLESIGNAPLTIIVLDERNTPFHDVAYARQMVERYLKAQPEVLGSPTMFVATSAQHRFTVIHDYTQSRAALLTALSKHGNEGDITSLSTIAQARKDPAPVGLNQVVAPLVQIADSVRDPPERKNIIWIGYGYPSVPTEHLNKQQSEAVQTMLHDVTDRLLRARVTLNIIDPEGTVAHDISTTDVVYQDVAARMVDAAALGSSASYGQEFGPYSGAFNFEKFATASGGHLIKGRNDIDALVERTTQDGAKYYTLTYTPTSTSEATQGFRKIRVVMKNPALTARTREGYFGGSVAVDKVTVGEKKQANPLEFDLVSAAQNELEYTALHVIAGPAAKGVAVRVRTMDLTWDAPVTEARKAEVTAFVVYYDKSGKNLGRHAKEMTISLRAEDKVNMSSMVAADVEFGVPAGTSRVRVVVRDGTTGKLGTADLKL
ncbi:VWA domain-containing protein [Edaphobacter aggregans]|uniref:VWA domain-containing protein n=1 Tax=Edaphobacter aggregans TaxID=570835 RepID=UPI00055659DD|nr:VWA domain-containing protein [Edaphobacter aggregans]